MMGIETMILKVMSRSDNQRNLVVRIELNKRIKNDSFIKPDDGSTLSSRRTYLLCLVTSFSRHMP